MNCLLVAIVLSASIFITGASASEMLDTDRIPTEFDYALREALANESEKQFISALELGGSPTAIFDNTQDGWVFCSATRVGNESYLRLLIEDGKDVNFRQDMISPELSLPLSCAIRFSNLAAIKLLSNAGADPTLPICVDCKERLPSSLLSEAVLVGKHDLAVWFLENGDYSDSQIGTVVDLIQRFPLPDSFDKKTYEGELVAMLRSKGIQVIYDKK